MQVVLFLAALAGVWLVSVGFSELVRVAWYLATGRRLEDYLRKLEKLGRR